MKLHLRDEARATERRAPITPDAAAALIRAGAAITVETSDKRVFSDAAYREAGCTLAPAGSWTEAPPGAVILGLKELPPAPAELRHHFVHFAHVFKEQTGWREQIGRFVRGGGALCDLEYLVDDQGRRLSAFGWWAGWMGAALGLGRLLARRLGQPGPERGVAAFDRRAEVEKLLFGLADKAPPVSAIVVGAAGRSGHGAVELLESAGARVTRWDLAETRDLDRDALLSHELLVNCVLMTGPGLVLATPAHLAARACRVEVIADVSCDPHSSFNPLPVYDAPTTWAQPVRALGMNGRGGLVEITAIDNLPSLLPLESSEDFSAQLAPCLTRWPDGSEWRNARAAFDAAVERAGLTGGVA